MDQVKIMIIDDEPIVGKRLKQALEKSGHDIETFETGASAIKRLEEKKFNIVVTDVRMDEIDGIDILNRVKQSWPDTKVIIITGYATIEVARQALAKGAFDFIAKPFKPNELREVIQKAIDSMKNQDNSSKK